MTRSRGNMRLTAGVVAFATVFSLAVVFASTFDADPASAQDPVAATTDTIAGTPYVPDDVLLSPQAAGQGDPLGLVLYPDEQRRYSLGSDVFEVWSCPDNGPVPTSVQTFVNEAEARMTEYFAWLSNGRYDPDFVVGGSVPIGEDCSGWAREPSHATGIATGALFIRNTTGGYAGPGFTCAGYPWACPAMYPDNLREGYIGVAGGSWSTLAHEIGHMLSFPHSNTGTGSDYDNAIDLMSGNYATWTDGSTTYWGTYDEPYATHAYNRYAAGWIDPSAVSIWNGTPSDFTLRTVGSGGTQAIVIDEGSSFFILDARVRSVHDPIPTAWEGVEVYEVDRCATCWSLNAVVTPTPPVPFNPSDLGAYSKPLPHMASASHPVDLCNIRISVTGSTPTSFSVRIEPTAAGFIDVCRGDTFDDEIDWLAAEGITKGCNPPDNTKFCPNEDITREQMAAFLTRALDLTDDGGGDRFTDDDASIFESDIDKLATAGITLGCNPPANTRFCPGQRVTRGQMAAFLYRALNP